MEDEFSQDEQMDFPGVDVQVTDYYFIGDGSAYDMHYFVVQVTNGKEKYVVDRSYVDFVVLQRNLLKLFIGSSVPDLPLRGFAQIDAVLAKETTNIADIRKRVSKDPLLVSSRISVDTSKRRSMRQNSTSPRTSVPATELFPIPYDSYEVIQALGPMLTLYICELTCHHELLVSDDFLSFLDEEVTDLLVPVIPPALTAFDLALINQSIRVAVVSRVEEHTFQVPPRHVVVWRFSTEKFDIGFHVDINGKTKIPLTRYRSQDAPVCGAMMVESFADITLRWDNSYAKLHSKQLSWSLRVLSAHEFETMKAQAMACLREKKRFEGQRLSLRKSTFAHATRLSGIVHGSYLEAEFADLEHQRLRKLERDASKLAERNELLLSDLEQAEVKLEDMETHRQALVDSKNLLSESWRFSNSQLSELEAQVKDMQALVEELQDELGAKDRELQALDDQLEGGREHLNQIQGAMQAIVENLQPKLELDERTWGDWCRRLEIRKDALLTADPGAAAQVGSDLFGDFEQVLGFVQHNQQVVCQVKDILAQLASSSPRSVSHPTDASSVTLSDF